MYRIALLALALAAATPALANPVTGPNPDYRIANKFAADCPPHLKFAAGACVPTCPAGYADNGYVCVLRNAYH
jgi:hypothetical protein